MGMYSLLLKIVNVYGKENLEISVDDDSIKTASIPDGKNPAIMDLWSNGMVVSHNFVTFVNPEFKNTSVPPSLEKFIMSSTSISAENNDYPYPVMLPRLITVIPGYTNNQDDPVRIKRIDCYLTNNGKCPEGYRKVLLEN